MAGNNSQNGANHSNGNVSAFKPLLVSELMSRNLYDNTGAPPPSPSNIQPEDLGTKDPSDGSNKAYHKVPYEYGDPVWQIGWTDGRYGQSEKANESVLQVEGQLQWFARLEAAEAKIAETAGEIAALKSTKDWLQRKVDATAVYFNSLNDRRQGNYQDFSRRLGVLYAFFAVVLLAADIPLSLRLVAAGIGVTTSFSENKVTFTPDDIFLNVRVLTHLWEAILLALGIAALGIFIKFFLDTVVFREEKSSHSRFSIAITTLTLLLLLSSIFVLGLYRADQQKEHVRQTVSERIKQIHRQRITAGLEKEMPADLTQEITTALNALPEESRWQSATFISLTLLLPLIAGFCFSTSGRKLRNASQFKDTSRALTALENEFRQVSEQLCKAEEGLRFQRERLDRDKTDPEIKKALAALPRLIYLHGYERGRNVPETLEDGATLYERCVKTVEKLLAKRARARLWRFQTPKV
jgi:hypothetical protein